MSLTNTKYYHGSKTNMINSFDLSYANENTPFGPAIYLTKDTLVANCYSQRKGTIYNVVLSGDLKYTINLDDTFKGQTIEIQNILKNIFSYKSIENELDIRELIHPFNINLKEFNNSLIDSGIWMLYGHLSSMEVSGLMDRGIQYAVLDTKYLQIV